MILSRVQIKNFRSIADATISFQPSCRILVGVNEAGKSNVLKALSLLSIEAKPTPADIREPGRDEEIDQDAYVRFIFALDEAEQESVLENLKAKVFEGAVANPPLLNEGLSNFTLKDFFTQTDQKEILYLINLKTGERTWARWGIPKNMQVLPNWKRPTANVVKNITIPGMLRPLATYYQINTEAIKSLPPETCEEIKPDDIGNHLFSEKMALVQNKIPKTVYWTYNEANLLPSQIPIDAFANNPETCRPLKNMFELAGYKNIKSAIDGVKNRQNGLRNLLNRVSEAGTKHVEKVWNECGGIKINLTYNATVFEANVEDTHNVYDFSRRSDGFKRFLSFLLTISAEAATDKFSDTLYLYDEPDISLHPSGARYLRDELIKISRKNTVVYSTHSIFMVDQNLISRHLIVKKENEITTVEEAGKSNVVDEEVVYNALGFSIFEHLKPTNIIFEGWRDKQLFRVALSGLPASKATLKNYLSDVGICHADGVKDIPIVAALMELANRKCIIVSDGDNPAKQKQEGYRGYGKWFRYDELLLREIVVTGEDFIKPEFFLPPIAAIRAKHPNLPEIKADDLKTVPKLSYIAAWLSKERIPSDEIKKMLNGVKEHIFSDLKVAQIEDKYFNLLEQLALKLRELTS